MTIYFEHLSFSVVLSVLRKEAILRKQNNSESNTYYYIDISFVGQLFLKYFKKFFNFEINKLEFELRHIKNDRGELIRLLIHNKDLFELQNNIVQSEEFSSNIHPSWKQTRLLHFIKKALVAPALLPHTFSYSNSLYLINVIAWYNKKTSQNDHILYLNKVPWQPFLIQYANERNVKTIFLNKKIGLSIRESIINQITKSPRLFTYIKNIKNIKVAKTVVKKSFFNQNKIFIKSRGHINFLNNGYNSDFFWAKNSEFPLSKIVYEYINNHEKNILEKNEIFVTNGYTKYFPIKNNLKYKNNNKDHYPLEGEKINSIINKYILLENYWYSFFKYYNIKLYLTWYDNGEEHMAIADSIKRLGGIAAYWQGSFLGKKDIECETNLDIGFYYSNFSASLSQTIGSKNRYYIITGYLNDYIYPLIIDQANQIRAHLKSAGAKNIVNVLDENSLDDSRYHSGHELQRENYSYILEKVLEIPWLGVIFKPKVAKTLRYRLGPVNELLKAAEKTGRCLVYEQYTGYGSTSAPPLLAGLASDICISSHLTGGTAALECALQELPTIMIDREGTPNSKLNDLPHGKVVFKSWPETIDAVMEHFRTPSGIPGFGDWSNMIDDLDPFRDGHAARRMGTYLKWLIDGLDHGLDRETIMADAAERYVQEWGPDKVVAISK